MSRRRGPGFAPLLLLITGLLSGSQLACETVPAPARPQIRQPQAVMVSPRKGGDAPHTPSAAEEMAVTDPCAIRLHDISGQMLWFYAVNHRLPQALDELKTTADPGADVDYTCPVTHKPYAYVPDGLQSQGQARKLVVYDSVPNPDGSRWVILIADPKPAQPLATWVVSLPEVVFRTYQPALP